MENVIDVVDKEEFFYFNKPSLMQRVKSMFADTMVIVLLMFLVATILGFLKIESVNVKITCFALIILYEPIFVSLGGTIGQRIMGLRVRSFYPYKKDKTEKSVNIFSSIIRYLFKILLGWVSLLTIHSDDYGRALHDKFSNSVMTQL